MKRKNLALAALTATSVLPKPTTPTSPTFLTPSDLPGSLSQSLTQYPLNAIYFPATRGKVLFRPYPSTNSTNGTDGGLSDSCTRCGPKGCLCSTVNNSTTDGILPFKSCSSCQDMIEGMVCFCAEKVQGADRCTTDNLSNGIPCHLNAVDAMVGGCTVVESSGDGGNGTNGTDGGDGGKPKANMISAGGKGKGVAVGTVAVAAVAAVAGMAL